MATVHRARATLKINRKNTVSVVGKANAMCVGIDAHPALFPAPNPTTSAIAAQVVIVNKAEVTAATRAKGAAAARNVQRNILVQMLETELTYVQGNADKCTTVEEATSTIQAAGLTVAAVPHHVKPILAATQAVGSGSVNLDANARALTSGIRGKALFNWQSTVDGKTFVSHPATTKAKTTIGNLTPLTSYGFRVSVTNSAGVAGEWSQVISILVQ